MRNNEEAVFESYDHQKIENKWQNHWLENKTVPTDIHANKDKLYALDMFPYPSGAGLHVGHPEGYTATDIISRMKRMQGYEVLHPMGWDAFGLPAEQYALDSGNRPGALTEKNIDTFRLQNKEQGVTYDRELSNSSTCHAVSITTI